ncbi:MAG TPA: hypothetical protein PLM79_17005, partial [Syntrophobacteraceae bacterium]|nr:hypothetical protein [Syntrophobacteraceae bacterium]
MHPMKRLPLFSTAVFLAAIFCLHSPAPAATEAFDLLTVSGAFLNPQMKPVKEVEIQVLVNGRVVKPMGKDEHIFSGNNGAFTAQFQLAPGALPGAVVEIRAQKPSWEPLKPTALKVVESGVDDQG